MLGILQGKREFYEPEVFQALRPCSSSKVMLEASCSVVAETQKVEKCATLGIWKLSG